MDLFAGAIVEAPLGDGLIGPVMSCVLGNQFKRIRDGDRLVYNAYVEL